MDELRKEDVARMTQIDRLLEGIERLRLYYGGKTVGVEGQSLVLDGPPPKEMAYPDIEQDELRMLGFFYAPELPGWYFPL